MGWSTMRRLAAVTLLVSVAASCRPPASIRRAFERPSPHQQYEAALRQAGLDGTALASAWTESSRRALSAPVAVSLPFREAAFFPPGEPTAVGYQLQLRRGQRLDVACEVDPADPLRHSPCWASFSGSCSCAPRRRREGWVPGV